jgi:hypothetical protein
MLLFFLQITFREIISHYKRQVHAKQEVFRTVVLEATDPGLVTLATGDIIAFYNQVGRKWKLVVRSDAKWLAKPSKSACLLQPC